MQTRIRMILRVIVAKKRVAVVDCERMDALCVDFGRFIVCFRESVYDTGMMRSGFEER